MIIEIALGIILAVVIIAAAPFILMGLGIALLVLLCAVPFIVLSEATPPATAEAIAPWIVGAVIIGFVGWLWGATAWGIYKQVRDQRYQHGSSFYSRLAAVSFAGAMWAVMGWIFGACSDNGLITLAGIMLGLGWPAVAIVTEYRRRRMAREEVLAKRAATISEIFAREAQLQNYGR